MNAEPIAAAIERLHRAGPVDEPSRPDEPQPDAARQARPGGVCEAGGGWTIDAVRRLGTTTDVPTAAKILGIGRTLAFRLVRTDAFPVRIVRAGTRITVPVPELLRALGASVEGDDRR